MQRLSLACKNRAGASLPSLPCGGNSTKKANIRSKEDWVEEVAASIFEVLDESDSGTIDLQQFTDALGASGLTEDTGLQFATLVFELMVDAGDETNSIDRRNFLAFALVSRALLDIHRKVSHFVDFVNVDCGEFVDVEDLEVAQEYLGEAALTEQERKELIVLNGTRVEGGAYFDVVELVNFVTVAYLETLVSEHRGSSERTGSLTS